MSDRPPGRYRLLLRLAGWAVTWERLWPRLWPAAAVIGLFLAVALSGYLPGLPGWLHAAVLMLFAAALAVVLMRALSGLRRVDRPTARRRLETDSRLDHRPLATLEDRLAAGAGDPAARQLWQRHQERARAAADRLTVRPPEPQMAAREPWGLRAGVVLLLVIAVAAAGRDAPQRLASAVAPVFAAGPSWTPVVEVWVRPPLHTGIAPLFLSRTQGGPMPTTDATVAGEAGTVMVPAGSDVLARVTGVSRPPVLHAGEAEAPFAAIDEGEEDSPAFRGSVRIEAGDRLAVEGSGGRTLAEWPIDVVADLPPSATLEPEAGEDGSPFLAYRFRAVDDYGVVAVEAVIENPAEPALGESAIRLAPVLAAAGDKSVEGRELTDLSAHPWAGQPVLMHLAAEDAIGQRGRSPPVSLVLPERSFSHPVARAIVAERKRLRSDADESVRRSVAGALATLAATPSHFADDITVSLALAVARARLVNDGRPAAIPQVRDLLWQTALRLDQGDVPFAERELQDARQALWSALRRDAPVEEIERLIDRLEEALDRYLQAVASEMARRGETMPPLDADTDVISSEHFRELLDMAREFARAGARNDARRLLAELQRMLDSIRSGMQSGPSRADLVRAHELMQDLRDIARRQQDLLDRTFQAVRDRTTPRGSSGHGRPQSDRAGEQAELRRSLGDFSLALQDFLNAIPAPLPEADQAMKGALDALGSDRLDEALSSQGAAMDALNRAMSAIGRALAQRLGAGMGLFGENPDEGSGSDPFGRAGADGLQGFGIGNITIPDELEVRRVHEILDELRRRANERHRPAAELDYIERLLRQF